MKAVTHMVWRLLFKGTLLAALTVINPYAKAAGWDPKDLPTSARRVLIEVRDLMNQKDYNGAIDRIKTLQAQAVRPAMKNPDAQGCHHPMVYFALGNCCLLKEDYAQAKKALLAALERDPEFVDAWLNLAKAHYELKAYTQAATCYASAYECSDPRHPDYLYFCAAGYLMAERYAPALSAFERLFKEHADRIQHQWRENYVNALLAAGHPRHALPLIKTLVAQSEADKKTRWQETLLYLYLQLDMHRQALSYATDLTRENCVMAKWWKALVHVNLSQGRYKEALAALTIYGYLTPLSAEERKLWADLNLQLDIPIKAAAIYEAMIREKPDKRLLQKLVSAYQKLDRSGKALEQLKYFASAIKDPELLMLKGDLLYGLKRFNEANIAYRRAAQADFRQAGRAWLLAGYAAWQTNDLEASHHAFRNAAKYSGQRKAARLAMAQLKKAD